MDHTSIRPGRHTLRVESIAELSPSMRRVTLAAPTLAGLPLRPGQDVGLVFAADDGRELRRRYTLRHVDPAAQTVELDGILHGHGPGAHWFGSVRPGDAIDAIGPRGQIELTDADWHLMVGDESALPAFAEILEALPDQATAIAIIEVEDTANEQPLATSASKLVHWVHRQGERPGRAELLAAAVRSLDFPSGAASAVLLGESRAVVALRPELGAKGITGRQVFLKGYWNYSSR